MFLSSVAFCVYFSVVVQYGRKGDENQTDKGDQFSWQNDYEPLEEGPGQQRIACTVQQSGTAHNIYILTVYVGTMSFISPSEVV